MNREELFASIVAARPDREDTVYLERRGDSYNWRIVSLDAVITETPPDSPDAWMCFSATWPANPSRMRVLFDDLLTELEAMADHVDRCRWPIIKTRLI
jgi:hypothetical protein